MLGTTNTKRILSIDIFLAFNFFVTDRSVRNLPQSIINYFYIGLGEPKLNCFLFTFQLGCLFLCPVSNQDLECIQNVHNMDNFQIQFLSTRKRINISQANNWQCPQNIVLTRALVREGNISSPGPTRFPGRVSSPLSHQHIESSSKHFQRLSHWLIFLSPT